MMLEAGLLFASVPLLHARYNSGSWLAAAACGLQHAMAGAFVYMSRCWLDLALVHLSGLLDSRIGRGRTLRVPVTLAGIVGLGHAVYRHRQLRMMDA